MKSQRYVTTHELDHIITRLRAGEIATIPTETVMGYAVSLDSKTGITKLMHLKNRSFDSGKIFTLVPEHKNVISKYAIIPEPARPLIEQYIPGEITLILPRNPNFHHFYFNEYQKRGELTGIGIRIPNYQPFLQILAKTGPLLLTSANQRGGAPTSITGHLPSTIIDFTKDRPKILRQGNLIIDLSTLGT